MSKSPDAFRTISEVADWLGIQAHVLRFWESKFTQVRPVKRAGGRRYYRPNDMLLLGGIKRLLHEDGLTIKGVQKILREDGMSHVAAMSQPLDELTQSQVDDAQAAPFIDAPEDTTEQRGVILNFESPQPVVPEEDKQTAADAVVPAPVREHTEDALVETQEVKAAVEAPEQTAADPTPPDQIPPDSTDTPPAEPDLQADTAAEPETPAPPEPQIPAEPDDPDTSPSPQNEETIAATLPAFLRRPIAEQVDASDNPPPETPEDAPESDEIKTPEPDERPKPHNIPMPTLTAEADFDVSPGVLSSVYRARSLERSQARQIAPLLDRLVALRDSMAANRKTTRSPGPND